MHRTLTLPLQEEFSEKIEKMCDYVAQAKEQCMEYVKQLEVTRVYLATHFHPQD